MNKIDKIKEGMTLIEVKEHYRPLEKPMVEETARKVRNIITELYQKKHIDEMKLKWLSHTPNPPRIPVFYTLTKTHKVNLSSRPIISGCDSPTERISAFVDSLLQPIIKEQQSYIKDTTQFINFIEGTRVPQNAVLFLNGRYESIYKYTARGGYHDHMPCIWHILHDNAPYTNTLS